MPSLGSAWVHLFHLPTVLNSPQKLCQKGIQINIISTLVSASLKAACLTDTYRGSCKSLRSLSWKFDNFLLCIIPTSADCAVLKFTFLGGGWREMKVKVGSCCITNGDSPCWGSQRKTRVGKNWRRGKSLGDEIQITRHLDCSHLTCVTAVGCTAHSSLGDHWWWRSQLKKSRGPSDKTEITE